MNIIILNYSDTSVKVVSGAPDDWESEQIEDYLFGKDELKLNPDEVYYMCSNVLNISISEYSKKLRL